jgi:hypothetical protein
VVHGMPFQERRGEDVTTENAVKPKQVAAK